MILTIQTAVTVICRLWWTLSALDSSVIFNLLLKFSTWFSIAPFLSCSCYPRSAPVSRICSRKRRHKIVSLIWHMFIYFYTCSTWCVRSSRHIRVFGMTARTVYVFTNSKTTLKSSRAFNRCHLDHWFEALDSFFRIVKLQISRCLFSLFKFCGNLWW